MLRFTIASTSTNEEDAGKKYVSYTVSITGARDRNPSLIERRYTHFFDLYTALKKDFPTLMANVVFPRKVMMGNFNTDVISGRSAEFGAFLEHVANETRLREAPCTISFLHKIELDKAKELMARQKYDQAFILLELVFTLLNKVYTDRSYVVLLTLCRLVACGVGERADSSDNAGPTELWADLALRRFDAVCDTELLSLYVPLIKACIFIRKTLGKDTASLEEKLEDMRKKGVRIDDVPNLTEAIEKLEK